MRASRLVLQLGSVKVDWVDIAVASIDGEFQQAWQAGVNQVGITASCNSESSIGKSAAEGQSRCDEHRRTHTSLSSTDNTTSINNTLTSKPSVELDINRRKGEKRKLDRQKKRAAKIHRWLSSPAIKPQWSFATSQGSNEFKHLRESTQGLVRWGNCLRGLQGHPTASLTQGREILSQSCWHSTPAHFSKLIVGHCSTPASPDFLLSLFTVPTHASNRSTHHFQSSGSIYYEFLTTRLSMYVMSFSLMTEPVMSENDLSR